MSDYPIPLRVVKPFPKKQEAGMMWRYENGDTEDRECWWIVLPSDDQRLNTPGHPSRISWRTTDRASDPPHEMWDVSGSPPNLTVSPSINILAFEFQNGEHVRAGSYWHGFITNGELINAG